MLPVHLYFWLLDIIETYRICFIVPFIFKRMFCSTGTALCGGTSMMPNFCITDILSYRERLAYCAGAN